MDDHTQKTLELAERFMEHVLHVPHVNYTLLMDGEFGDIVEDLWDRVYLDPFEGQGIRVLYLPPDIHKTIIKVCLETNPNIPVSVHRLIHFPEDWEPSLTSEQVKIVRKTLKSLGVWNPIREYRQQLKEMEVS